MIGTTPSACVPVTSIAAIGYSLFTDYAFQFEVTSVLILVAMVGVGVAAPFQLGGWHRMLGLSESQSESWNQLDLRTQVQAFGRGLRLASARTFKRWQPAATVLSGAVLGVLVTLTSVGAGALCAVLLTYLYPLRMTPRRLVATDLVHAIPLTVVYEDDDIAVINKPPGLTVHPGAGQSDSTMQNALLHRFQIGRAHV